MLPRTSRGRPSISAVTPLSAFSAASSMASILAVERSPCAGVEFHVERIDRAPGLPEVIGHDADRVVVLRAAVPLAVLKPASSLATATTGTFTTARTPGIARISASFLMATTCPVKERAVLMAAFSIPGTTTSMPKTALPLHFAGVSRRATGLPIS